MFPPSLLPAFVFVLLATAPVTGIAEPAAQWRGLPPLPDAEGFAGAFAGVSGGALIVAGGANFPREKWSAAPVKVWHDTAFVLERPNGEWRSGFRLPRPLGYGVSVSTDDGIVCIGGSDAERHHADVFRLAWRNGKLIAAPLPPLPSPCANACGALLGRTIYVAGGIESPSATVAMRIFRALDLDATERGWREEEPWPGPERMLAVAGVQDGAFFLFSGARLTAGADGKPAREFLRDAYRFTPGKGWRRIADLPRAAVAAPSPAITIGAKQMLLVSGDDGTQVTFSPLEKHPGFPRDALLYDVEKDAWSPAGAVPFSRATATVVPWHGGFAIPSGETRPRERSPEVWMGTFATPSR
jgi:N-acetylneuraminate epimerase